MFRLCYIDFDADVKNVPIDQLLSRQVTRTGFSTSRPV
jgi:hypothetical protein